MEIILYIGFNFGSVYVFCVLKKNKSTLLVWYVLGINISHFQMKTVSKNQNTFSFVPITELFSKKNSKTSLDKIIFESSLSNVVVTNFKIWEYKTKTKTFK